MVEVVEVGGGLRTRVEVEGIVKEKWRGVVSITVERNTRPTEKKMLRGERAATRQNRVGHTRRCLGGYLGRKGENKGRGRERERERGQRDERNASIGNPRA